VDRLSKVLAHRGVASRRRCEELIGSGRIRVNGRIVTEQGVKVDPERDSITLDGKPVQRAGKVYILLHKPAGYVSTSKDPQGRPTVLDLVPVRERVYPVGRLDMHSEGLLLLTNDGAVTERLTHPRYEHDREYWVLVNDRPSGRALDRLREGVELEDGRTWPALVSRLPQGEVQGALPSLKDAGKQASGTWLRVVIHEGRKRQVRRMCEAIGHPVRRLVRVRMGPLRLGDLKPGDWRHLSGREIRQLHGISR